MPREYNLKLDPNVKAIIKFFLRYMDFKQEQGALNDEKDEKHILRKGLSVTSYLRPIIHGEVNKLIAYLEAEKEENKERFESFLNFASQNLDKKDLNQVLKLIDKKIRF